MFGLKPSIKWYQLESPDINVIISKVERDLDLFGANPSHKCFTTAFIVILALHKSVIKMCIQT